MIEKPLPPYKPHTDENRPAMSDVFYSSDKSLASSYGPKLTDSVNQLGDAHGWTDEERSAHTLEFARMSHASRVNPGPAAQIYALIAKHVLEPADDITKQQWSQESRRHLREKYGSSDAGDQKMARLGKRLAAEHPAIAKLLHETGVGEHPDVVKVLVENADNPRGKPTRPAA